MQQRIIDLDMEHCCAPVVSPVFAILNIQLKVHTITGR